MLAFCGFNGFGQFGDEHERFVSRLTEFQVKELECCESNENLLIAPAWSYTAFARHNQLLLRGFLSKSPDATYIITTPSKIQKIAACDRFCLIACENGKLYKLLPTKDAQLMQVILELDDPMSELSVSLPQKRTIFGELKSKDFQITYIACGVNIAVAVTNTNAVYSIPSKVHQFAAHIRIQQIDCGFEHALLLTGNGDVYAWGYGLRCQLGQEEVRNEEAPILVDALAGVKITCIAAGGWHSVALSVFGDLYAWGFNTNGQLGLPIFKKVEMTTGSGIASNLKNPSVYPIPQIIDLPKCHCKREVSGDNYTIDDGDNDCPPIRVFAGARHTTILMQCGALYAVGWNRHGQLGTGSTPEAPIDTTHRLSEFVDSFKLIEHSFLQSNDDHPDVICAGWCMILQFRNK